MPQPTILICIDGLDPEYLEACDVPNIAELGRKGFRFIGHSMMPSVTNVNNVSLVTARYPKAHGINSNYWLNTETGEESYMESGKDILCQTFFHRATVLGRSTLMVSSKDKVRTLIGDGATISFSSERPLEEVVRAIGEPPPIYSLEVNGWIIQATKHLMAMSHIDLAYIATTDYAMHTYAPDHPKSREHMTILDDAIGDLVEAFPQATVLITADHGMSTKARMVDLKAVLAKRGIRANPVAIIKDRYVVHHSNLGGCAFVYLEQGDVTEAVKVLQETPGVETALVKDEAVARFKLHRGRLGDIMVTGEKDVVFGDPMEAKMRPGLRSHGSLHERRVPIIGYNGDFHSFAFKENRDMGRYIFEKVLV